MFKEIPHTADVALYVESTTFKGLFYDAAIGLISISDISISTNNKIHKLNYRDKSYDKETLLINWLNFIIYQLDNELYLLNCNISIHKNSLSSICYFKNLEKKGLLIKSATFYNLKIIKSKNLIHTTIIFDV